MTGLSKYFYIASTSAKSNVAYLGEVASRVIFLAVILYIFLRLWQVTYAETGASELGGFTLAQMLWYLAVTESIILSAPRITQMVDRDVRTGELAVHLIKPMSYPLYCLGTSMGERVVRFALNLSVGLVIAVIFVGPIPLGPLSIACLLLALPLAFILDFLANFLIGLGAFWLEDTTGLVLIYSRITMILGGMLIPIELFPEAMQSWLRVLPFASIVYGPAKMLVAPSTGALAELLVIQSLGIVGVGALVAIVYGIASRRVFANGG
ncbi:MAG: ABC-2 family transporter protein [Cyanobacteria bacterium HKST-UBA02]|nr:ABC-2 family transporter protein [Cyanobacteria bacterium HKST-UBA02]